MRTSKKDLKNKKNKNDVIVEVDTAKLLRLVVTVLMSVVFLIGLFFFVRSFLPATKFEVNGVMTYKIYDDAELLNAAGIKRGTRLYSIDIDDAEGKILENCAYLEKVSLKRRFPNKLIIEVEERLPHWYIGVGGKFYSLDSELKIIEEVATDTNYVSAGVTRLELPNIQRVVVDELPSFGDSELEIKKTVETISAIRETAFKGRITGVDLKSRFNVYIELDHNKQVYMGNAENMTSKLDALEAVMESIEKGNESIAYIDASNPASISYGSAPHGDTDKKG